MNPAQELELLNNLIKSAAILARNAEHHQNDIKGHASSQLLYSVARTVWRQDLPLARRLIVRSPAARKLIMIDDLDDKVILKDSATFNIDYNLARSGALYSRIKPLQESGKD